MKTRPDVWNLMRPRILAALALAVGHQFAFLPRAQAEAYRGDINGWGTTWMAQDMGFGSIWKTTVTSGTSRAASGFKLDRSGDWAESWGTGSQYSQAAVNTAAGQAHKNVDGNNPGDMTFTNEVSGRRYTFCLAGLADWWYRPFVIQETDNDPVSLVQVFDNHVQDPSDAAVTVTVQLATNRSSQETIWLRASTAADFSTSTLVAAAGSGTSYTATLPAQSAGTRVYYYVFTSTMPSNVVAASPDLCTLRGLNAGGSNYSFRSGAATTWHLPFTGEPAGAFMRNPPTNGMSPAAAVSFYAGVYTASATVTNGALHLRRAGDSNWTVRAMAYDSTAGNNVYWRGAITGNTFAAGEQIEYYIDLTYSDAEPLFLGSTNDTASIKYLLEASAQATPFHFTYGSVPVVLGNAWHNPYVAEPPGATMRNPRYPYADQDVYVYSGNQYQGAGNAADQSGATLYHRLAPTGTWQSVAFAFDSAQGNNKYWNALIPARTYTASNRVDYYLAISYNDRDTTWLGTQDDVFSIPYPREDAARSNAFSFVFGGAPGTEAGYVWHADNRVIVGPGRVQFWTKIGYAEGAGSNRWVDAACLYVTTNGTNPQIAGKGAAANADTLVLPLSFDHMEEDAFPGGDAMWWGVTATNLPTTDGSVITYQIGAWKGDGLERFAEYNTSEPADKRFSFSLFVPGAAGLTVNGQNADYTTTKCFIDELADETQTVSVVYTPPAGASNVQVYANLNRRDLCDVDYNHDGVPDGISPPLGNTISVSDTGAYFTAFAMAGGPTTYFWTGVVSRCGAYRLTARYQLNATNAQDWTWYSSEGRRDHAVVVSPVKVHAMTMYELNPLIVKATSDTQAGRSTFADLTAGDSSGYTNFNLGYLDRLGVNCLWFQPIHPNAQERKDEFEPGSPYATRNYYAVSRWYGRDGTEAGALAEFTNFVGGCDAWTGGVGTINVVLDGVFNHSAWDAIFGEGGVTLGLASNANDRIGSGKPGWYSLWTDYGQPATFYTSATNNDIATAPDRGDFGKWFDVADFFLGRYSCLVRHNPEDNGNYVNEGDVYDFAGMAADTRSLWRYFAYYPEYWLKKTGHSGANSSPADGSYAQRLALDDRGIDGLRCDFAQGVPPQAWEYIINRTRHLKWNFVFMAETLDGGVPGYRSNRHFDVLNEDLVFKFTQQHVSRSSEIRQALEDRRAAYRGGAVLLNLTSHDEVMPESDAWITASRYGALSMVDGMPMIFYGQEWGIGPSSGEGGTANTGFAHFEQNFGKWIPHFKRWNRLTVWDNPPAFSDGLPAWYSRVNRARLASPALRSSSRYFLQRLSDGAENDRILAVAKVETPSAGPATGDVVLAFALVLNGTHDEAQDTYNLQPCWGMLGLDTNKLYNVRNLASSTPQADLWPSNMPGWRLWNEGVWVHLTADKSGPIAGDGALVQYIKIEERGKADQAIAGFLPTSGSVVLQTSTVALSATASSGLPVSFRVASGLGVITGGTNLSFTGRGEVQVVAAQAGDSLWNAAPEVTNAYTVLGVFTLNVQSERGSTEPTVGPHEYVEGAEVTNRVGGTLTLDTTQYVATGWSMTGQEPSSGTGTEFVMTVTNNAVLAWLWSTNYWLDTAAGPHGTVALGDGWFMAGSNVAIRALPEPYYHFTNWTGDVSGSAADLNPLDLAMDGPRAVAAQFAENRTANTGTPEWWLAQHGWTNDFETAAAGDDDHDRSFTWAEYIAGTDPTNAASVLRVAAIRSASGAGMWRVLSWPSVAARQYAIAAKPALGTNAWEALTNGLPADPPQNVWTDQVDRGSMQYYRIEVAPAP